MFEGETQVILARARIWKRRAQYFAVVKDELAVEELTKHLGDRVTLVINLNGVEIPIEAKPIRDKEYIVFTLPRRLNALWETINETKAKIKVSE
ncbi:hypothetical protein GCM10007981_04650 [Thermocladium modestius]|uniref:Uncharacterized protein n=1 Tax=Thermocladium modestius TaxID=62609 RepID=A0A830GUX9_9CREN|nr:hypothetical protein [Thermocladium modestius]GGP19741.1 hypothetical protein GCM10007981_04650 [Thermocladium modestius]